MFIVVDFILQVVHHSLYELLDFGCDHMLRHTTAIIVVDSVVSVIDDSGNFVILYGHCFFVVFINTVQPRLFGLHHGEFTDWCPTSSI